MGITDNIKSQLEKELQDLQRMREDIRATLHRAGQDARDKWKELEPKLEELERKVEAGGKELGEAGSKLFEDIGKAVRDFANRVTTKE